MERFWKRKSPPSATDQDEGSSQQNKGASNISAPTRTSLILSPKDVNLDELPYDPADRKRIIEYPGFKLQEEIRRRYLIRGPHRPQPGFSYPQTIIGKKPRRFNPDWFEQYDWLEYSEKVDKAFCLYCYLFRDCIDGQAGNDAFVTKGFSGWNNKPRLDTHVGGVTSCHNAAIKRYNNLLKPSQSIEFALKKQQDVAKEEYFIRLSTSINAIRYLLHQGLAFRGHNESEDSAIRGNFLELVKLLAEQNEKIKRVVLRNAPENHQMVSPEIQKDIANCFAEIIVNSIIEEIGGDVFCLLVDESADVSDKEQMLWFCERLIGVVHVAETTSACLKSNIDALFSKYKLSWKQVRGQGYDGASNMRGEFNGLRALILRENGSAHYVHCFAHQLQLVIVAVAKKNDDISDFFYMISLLLNVAGASCKRKDMIRQSQQERVKRAIGSGQISTRTGLNQEKTLQRPRDTRWCSHYKTLLKSLNSLFPSVIEVLQYVEKDGPNDKKRRQARGLLDYLKDFDFVFHLHMMLMILGHANSLSLCLQRKDQDILEAISEVKLTKQKFQQIRDDGWESLLQTIYSFCEEHSIPKLDMEEEYIDRHKPRKNLLTYMAALSPKDSFGDFKLESLMELAKLHLDDFNQEQLKDLAHELPIYIDNIKADERFSNLNSITALAKLMVDTNKHQAFPLVYKLLKLVLILPVATASVVRCFSAMKIVKTILRNRIGNTFMNDCIICFVEPAFVATISDNAVIDRFQKMKNRNRRMLL
ncbi:hypothetical protein PAHAL_5G328300 [Panicum hallii]|uniref:TTF-type domain-containing protein n=1 Tax=Panicum hallii TaxID=206008 RepID=A0A2T8IM09_9POAL|nr:hypothetical protein PAHAL_5G328300 [Panicum hallii]